MAWKEFDSFIAKFKSLLVDGRSAKLTVRADAGKASAILEVNFSNLIPPSPRKNRPPSYYRRQAKRRDIRNGMNSAAPDILEESNTAAAAKAVAATPKLPNLLHNADTGQAVVSLTQPSNKSSVMNLTSKTTASHSTFKLTLPSPNDVMNVCQTSTLLKSTQSSQDLNRTTTQLNVLPPEPPSNFTPDRCEVCKKVFNTQDDIRWHRETQ